MHKIERVFYLIFILFITTLSVIGRRKESQNSWILKENNKNQLASINAKNIVVQQSEDFIFDPDHLLINQEKDTICIKDLSLNGGLILYLNPYSCNVCLDTIFNSVKAILGEKELTVVSSSEGYRDLLVQFANNEYPYRHYCLIDDFKLPVCDEGVPFLFWLDQHLIAKHVFIPDKSNPYLTEVYLTLAKRKFSF